MSCIIMSVCDLGQALVMPECPYMHAPDHHAAHWTTISEETQSALLWTLAVLLLLTVTKLLLVDVHIYSGHRSARGRRSGLFPSNSHVCAGTDTQDC